MSRYIGKRIVWNIKASKSSLSGKSSFTTVNIIQNLLASSVVEFSKINAHGGMQNILGDYHLF